jgi:hypothetical protein
MHDEKSLEGFTKVIVRTTVEELLHDMNSPEVEPPDGGGGCSPRASPREEELHGPVTT